MRQAFDIFANVYDLLQVLVLSIAKDGVVDDDAVDGVVVVGIDDGVLKEFAVDLSKLEREATVWSERGSWSASKKR